MADVMKGQDALDLLNQTDESSNNEFNSFKSGTSYKVKVLGPADIIMFYSYGIFKKVNSFVAEKPSKKTDKGFPTDDLTPWDEAFLYHNEKSEKFQDKHSQEAYKYRAKQRYAFGFYNLEDGELIVVDLSKAQGQAIYKTINKYAKKGKLDSMAFELSKEGSSTNTTVSLDPIIDLEEDLTEKELKNFENAPKEFDEKRFEGILYEADEEEMLVRLHHEAGFDVTKIGYDVPITPQELEEKRGGGKKEGNEEEDGGKLEVEDDDLPY